MSDIHFYHLTESSLDEALPVLLEKSLARNWRVAIQTGSTELRDRLDAHLWTYRADSFMAHGSDADERSACQPVLLTTSPDNLNNAQIRFLVGNTEPSADLSGYERIIVMFDGLDDEALSGARGQWKALKTAGHDLTYWQQSPDGRWERKA